MVQIGGLSLIGDVVSAAPRSALMRVGFLGQNDMGGAALEGLCNAGVSPAVILTRPPSTHPNAVELSNVSAQKPHVVSPRHPGEIAEMLQRHRVDLMVCCGWSRRITRELLQLPRWGWLNLHPSWLPHWRGSNPIGWQMISGTTSLGYTVHQMTEAIDHGTPLIRGFVDLPAGADGGTARRILGKAMGRVTAELCRSGWATSVTPQNPDHLHPATACPPNGVLPLLDPALLRREPAIQAIRAFAPYPGAAVTAIPAGMRAVAIGEVCPRFGNTQLHRYVVEFVDGPLTLWCRRA